MGAKIIRIRQRDFKHWVVTESSSIPQHPILLHSAALSFSDTLECMVPLVHRLYRLYYFFLAQLCGQPIHTCKQSPHLLHKISLLPVILHVPWKSWLKQIKAEYGWQLIPHLPILVQPLRSFFPIKSIFDTQTWPQGNKHGKDNNYWEDCIIWKSDGGIFFSTGCFVIFILLAIFSITVFHNDNVRDKKEQDNNY